MRVTRRSQPESSPTMDEKEDEREARLSPARADGLVLGIDQSLSGFGFCFMDPAGKGVASHKGFDPKVSTGIDRLIDVECWLAGVLAVYGPQVQHVCMEGYARERKQGREEAGELSAVVRLVLRRLGVPVGYPTIVSPNQVKKYATANGRAQKSDIKLHVFRKWGEEFRNDNEADAYVLAKIAHALHYGGEPLGYEREVLDKLRRHTEWVRS